MADISLSDRACTINLSVTQSLLDDLIESISKSVALIQVALQGDFLNCEYQTQYDYLWVLSDLMNHAKQACDQFELNHHEM